MLKKLCLRRSGLVLAYCDRQNFQTASRPFMRYSNWSAFPKPFYTSIARKIIPSSARSHAFRSDPFPLLPFIANFKQEVKPFSDLGPRLSKHTFNNKR